MPQKMQGAIRWLRLTYNVAVFILKRYLNRPHTLMLLPSGAALRY